MTLTESLIQKAQHVGLNTYYMPISYDDFIQLDPWIKQRDDLLRIEKSKTNHMNKLGDTHLLVAIGILTEDGDQNSFNSIHYELIERISSAIKINNVKRLLHISSLNADVYAPSQYLQSKGRAEDYLLTTTSKFSRVNIFRPSIVFGENDSFFNRFDKLLKFLFVFPLACPKSKFQPIYVSDLTDFMISTINNSEYYNIKVDAVGPKIYSFIELIRLILKITERRRLIIPLNNLLSKIQAHVFQRLPGKIFTMDIYNSLQIESTCSDG